MKKAVLPSAHALAHLPKEYLESELVSEESGYNAGWNVAKTSTGKLTSDKQKGGFYFNPITDDPCKENKSFYPKNKWPSDDKMPGFKEDAKNLGTVMHETLVKLARHVDAFVGKTHETDISLYDSVSNSGKAKCRLLYYYPVEEKTDDSQYWNGWHVDTGFLTGLAGDFYVNDANGEESMDIDKDAGLYTASCEGVERKVEIPPDCMGVQFGGCLQILAGGKVKATPHCVKSSVKPGQGRAAMVCFVDTADDFVLVPPKGMTKDEALNASIPSKAPVLLREVYGKDGATYGDIHMKYEGLPK